MKRFLVVKLPRYAVAIPIVAIAGIPYILAAVIGCLLYIVIGPFINGYDFGHNISKSKLSRLNEWIYRGADKYE